MNQMVGYHFQLLLIRGNVPNLPGRNFPHTTTGAPRLNRLSPLTARCKEFLQLWPRLKKVKLGQVALILLMATRNPAKLSSSYW